MAAFDDASAQCAHDRLARRNRTFRIPGIVPNSGNHRHESSRLGRRWRGSQRFGGHQKRTRADGDERVGNWRSNPARIFVHEGRDEACSGRLRADVPEGCRGEHTFRARIAGDRTARISTTVFVQERGEGRRRVIDPELPERDDCLSSNLGARVFERSDESGPRARVPNLPQSAHGSASNRRFDVLRLTPEGNACPPVAEPFQRARNRCSNTCHRVVEMTEKRRDRRASADAPKRLCRRRAHVSIGVAKNARQASNRGLGRLRTNDLTSRPTHARIWIGEPIEDPSSRFREPQADDLAGESQLHLGVAVAEGRARELRCNRG